MLRYDKRPDKPDGFDDAVKDAKAKIQKIIDERLIDDRKPYPKSEDFEDVWSQFKKPLSQAQDARCGFCDTITNDSIGDVEHFRPKAGVHELSDDPRTWAIEVPGTANAEGRHFARRTNPGYWWLAYEWDNYLYSCQSCNRSWKGNLFPVAEGAARQWPPRKDGPEETPLLLHCYGRENPSQHLKFNPDGSVEALDGSLYGWETIKTCGLDKQTLRTRRRTITERVFELIRRISEHGFDEPIGKTALRELLELGNSKDRDMPGIVRIIAEMEFDEPWDDLANLAT
jgi:hypothetical protein